MIVENLIDGAKYRLIKIESISSVFLVAIIINFKLFVHMNLVYEPMNKIIEENVAEKFTISLKRCKFSKFTQGLCYRKCFYF